MKEDPGVLPPRTWAMRTDRSRVGRYTAGHQESGRHSGAPCALQALSCPPRRCRRLPQPSSRDDRHHAGQAAQLVAPARPPGRRNVLALRGAAWALPARAAHPAPQATGPGRHVRRCHSAAADQVTVYLSRSQLPQGIPPVPPDRSSASAISCIDRRYGRRRNTHDPDPYEPSTT